MNTTYFTFPAARPSLVIERTGGGNIGNCYNSMIYRVTSAVPLSLETLRKLREAGFLGYGQEFYAHLVSPTGQRIAIPALDRDQVATGVDVVPGVEVDSYSKKPVTRAVPVEIPTQDQPFFAYDCESRVDSSD